MVKHSKNKNCSEQLWAVISMRVAILCPVKMTTLLCLFCLTSSDFMEDILSHKLLSSQDPMAWSGGMLSLFCWPLWVHAVTKFSQEMGEINVKMVIEFTIVVVIFFFLSYSLCNHIKTPC